MCTDKICNHAHLWGYLIHPNLWHRLPYMLVCLFIPGPEVWGFWAGEEHTILSPDGVRVLGFIPDENSRPVQSYVKRNNFLTLWNLYHRSNSACLDHDRQCLHSQQSSYLPGTKVNRDHEGGSFRVRPFHCTSVGLTPTIASNVGNSSA